MPHFLIRWGCTAEGGTSLARDPRERVTATGLLARSFDGEMKSYFFALGEWDGIGIFEFPDTVQASAFVLHLRGTGRFARIEATQLLTPEEGETALHVARVKKTLYRIPVA